jgi:hypothetical protein
MISRHRDQLLTRLERLNNLGSCEIRHAELKLWYDRERLTKSIWMDFLERWEEVCGDDTPLLVGPGEGLYTFVFGDGLTASDTSWWTDVRTWAKQEVTS